MGIRDPWSFGSVEDLKRLVAGNLLAQKSRGAAGVNFVAFRVSIAFPRKFCSV